MTLGDLNAAGERFLPGRLGLEIESVENGHVLARMPIVEYHLAPNGYLHAASVIALADTACGYGCILSLPEGATGFTTIELKANFVRTAREGTIGCETAEDVPPQPPRRPQAAQHEPGDQGAHDRDREDEHLSVVNGGTDGSSFARKCR